MGILISFGGFTMLVFGDAENENGMLIHLVLALEHEEKQDQE